MPPVPAARPRPAKAPAAALVPLFFFLFLILLLPSTTHGYHYQRPPPATPPSSSTTTTTTTTTTSSRQARHSSGSDRRHVLARSSSSSGLFLTTAALLSLSPFPPPAAHAASSSGKKSPLTALVSLIRVQTVMKTLTTTLQEILKEGKTSAPPEVNQQIKFLVSSTQMKSSIEDAVVLLSASGQTMQAEAARAAGRYSYEYLSQIIEFSGYDKLSKPGVGKFSTLASVEKIEFALKCLEASNKELEKYFGFFPRGTVTEARETYQMYFGDQ